MALPVRDPLPSALDLPDLRWDERDVMLYALGVGAGPDDLDLTLETRPDRPLRVLPTFGAALLYPAVEAALKDADWTNVLFAEQTLELDGPLPAAGAARVEAAVTALHDQGRSAMVTVTAQAVDAATGARLCRSTASMFVRGAGGFGGERAPSAAWPEPDGEPDVSVALPTRPEQALLYRLTGDRNPLHADPAFAQRAGFDGPILHGLCTYGGATRVLLRALEVGDVAAVQGRFTAPVVPGETLTVRAWRGEGAIAFAVAGEDDRPVLERGVLTPR